MSYINEPCGCDGGNDYNSQVNNSPILSGSHEITFSPQANNFSFLEGNENILGSSKNNFSNNDDTKENYSLDDLISMSNENENNQVSENKFSNNNIQQMNNQNNFSLGNNNSLGNAYSNDINNQALNNVPNVNNRTGNAMPDPGMMRNIPSNVNPELQAVMNKINAANQLNAINKSNDTKSTQEEASESSWRFIVKNFNIVLIVVIGLAWSDVAKFYINRSIKFGGGNHKYYIYYALIASVVLYGTSKYVHHLE